MPEFQSLVGGQLGQFEIKDELGRGGMAVVYKGYQASLDRWVAIKTLPQEFAGKREMVSRFHREAEAMVSLNHSNIVQIIDKGEDKGLYYFAMEFVDGPSLQDLLKESRSKDLMFDIAQQVTEGLAYAHKKGIVHRDIKPGNVLWETATSLAKIADFGIARLTQKPEEMITLTATNVGMGTMNYMAPEQKTDAASVDHRADIYSLGVMIYEMFTGTLPMGRFKLPSVLDPSLPKKFDEIVTKCMEPDPVERYANMEELAADLAYAREHAGDGGTLVRSVRDVADRTLTAIAGEQHKGKAGFACCLLIMIGLGFGAFAAYTKGLIPGVGPEVAKKTEKTKKTRRTSSSGDDDDDDEPDKTPEKTGGGEKTGDTKTPEKTDDEPTKTKDPDPTPTKTKDPDPTPTKDPDPTPTKTKDPDPTPTKTKDPDPTPTKTKDPDPTPTKTPDPTPTPKPTPKVDEFKPAFDRAKRAIASQIGTIDRQSAPWKLTRRGGLDRAIKDARKAMKAKPSRSAVQALDSLAPRLQKEFALALSRHLSDEIQAVRDEKRIGLRSAVDTANRAYRGVTAASPEKKISTYLKTLKDLSAQRAVNQQDHAEAARAVALIRVGSRNLREADRNFSRAQAQLRQGEAAAAYRTFSKARTQFMEAQPVAPTKATFKAVGVAKTIAPRRAKHFVSIAPAPGGRVFAIAQFKSSNASQGYARLFLLKPSGSKLVQEWEATAHFPTATYSVACAGLDSNGNYIVWVGTQENRGEITEYRFEANSGEVAKSGSAIAVNKWIYDMVVGADGRLYVLLPNRVAIYFQGRRTGGVRYSASGFAARSLLPRRLAVLPGERLAISGFLDDRLPEIKGGALQWNRSEVRMVRKGLKGKFDFGSKATPFAITSVGMTLIAHDRAMPKTSGKLHLLTENKPKPEEPNELTKGQRALPFLSTDMAYSNGLLYVLDALGPAEGGFMNLLGRKRIVVYKLSVK